MSDGEKKGNVSIKKVALLGEEKCFYYWQLIFILTFREWRKTRKITQKQQLGVTSKTSMAKDSNHAKKCVLKKPQSAKETLTAWGAT